MARMIFGIIGVVAGLVIIVATLTHSMYQAEPTRGYIFGGLLIAFGIYRFLRGANRV